MTLKTFCSSIYYRFIHASYSHIEDDYGYMLIQKISDISEDYWCAGWLSNIEFDIWKEYINFKDHGLIGKYVDSEKSFQELKYLHKMSGHRWAVWNDTKGRACLVSKYDFIKLYESK